MGGEPICPECGTTVLPDWDWCQGCGFDPEGLRVDQPPARRAKAAPAVRLDVTDPGVLLDLDVNQKRFGKKHLLVTRDRLVFGNDTVDFARVTGYAWSPLAANLRTPEGEVKVVFGEPSSKKKAAKPDQADAFERLVGICDEVVGPRLATDAVAQIRSGDGFEVDKLLVSREGVSIVGLAGSREYPWAEFAGAEVQRGSVHVFIRGYERPQKVTEVAMATMNGPLVPRVTARCFAEFGP